ncbi:MAG TPA: YggS family pyridoxal phosphate-dependent enzyme [Anaerolineaceae bacterium]
MDLVESIFQNYRQVSRNIEVAAARSNRSVHDVQVVVVTKQQPVSVIQAAIKAGISIFGENYPVEAVDKINYLSDDRSKIQWHMIGHIQGRKVKLVADHFDYIHSLDRFETANRLSGYLSTKKKAFPVLIEVNISGESSKYGLDASHPEKWQEIASFVRQIYELPGVDIRGLMTMPPFTEDAEQSRPYFRSLKRLQQYLNQEIKGLYLTELSMGTSADYITAVEEGATMVRIGQAILGSRPN